ncbi:ZIP family metal transporter [Candidatus Bathyarchaeota archaeon]|nr:ZIP family metal transporter [Candidatus Bathyarchaeota archaeon]
MDTLITILASVTAVSLISLIGVIFVGLKEAILKRILMILVGFSSGTLLGSAFLDLLPEALNESELGMVSTFSLVILGIVVFFALEKFLYWRHCHEGECEAHMFAYLNLVGDGTHNLIDGMIIAAAFLFSPSLGLSTTLAVAFHEIPQEIGDFGVQVYGGLGKKKALAFNFISALTAVLGALIVYFLSHVKDVVAYLVPFAAGGFIYIAATDLMPELHKKTRLTESVVQLLSILLGIGLMAYLATTIGG